jgi:predicted CoA-binding protein
MNELEKAVAEFLVLRRIAVVGVSREGSSPANLIYRKLKATGHQVFAVNPKTRQVEGDPCYPDLASIPGGVEGAVIVTRPEVTASVVDECAAVGVTQVWIHRSFGQGSVSEEAIERCREHGIAVIPGGCPMMHCAPVDPGHACMRGLLRLTGGLPKPRRGDKRRYRAGDLRPASAA